MSFRVGIAVRDITPPESWIRDGRIWLWGYGSRSEPCTGVRDPLTVRALAVTDAAGATIVLAAVDLGAVDPRMTAGIRARIFRSHSIPPHNVCINVTHTHGAPVPVSIPTWQPGFTTPDPEYLSLVEEQTVAAIGDAICSARPASMCLGRGATAIGFDRHFGEPGFHDPTLDVLKALDEQGKPLCIACFASCHPVCLGDHNQVYADFPGRARLGLERRFGCPALFFQGYCGISNPLLRDPEAIGAALANDTAAIADQPMDRLDGPVCGWTSAVDLPFQPLPGEDIRAEARGAGGIHARWAAEVASRGDSASDALPTPLQALRVGAGAVAWYILAAGHEVTADFAPPVRALRPSHHVTLLGFSNSQLSYIPSRRVLTLPRECERFPFCENYEGGVAFAWYGHRAPLTLDVDERFIGAHSALLVGEPAA
jgi:neutral ceramidase